ncbi:hypothetical protein KAJ27_20275 [bacterium]|nr:hypothetical protein [bacterium]
MLKKKYLIILFLIFACNLAFSLQISVKIAEEALQLYKANDTLGAIKKIQIAYLMDQSNDVVSNYYRIIMSKRDALIKNVLMNAEFF